MIHRSAPIALLLALLLAGCDAKDKPAPAAPQKPAESASAVVKPAAVHLAGSAAPTASGAYTPQKIEPLAKVGVAAPDFTLNDLDGNPVSLASFRGKTVVLEWFNPECPFVKLSHGKGSLIDTAARQTQAGVMWLAINSGAPGKQGHGVEKNREGKKTFKLTHPILLDEDGKVGRAYGAERTPHLFVISADGVLVYRGAIDNSPDGQKGAPTGGTLVNYVEAALADLAAKRPVATAETAAYGCRVKYAD